MEQSSKARLCHLVKCNLDQEYGFDLHSDRNRGVQFIGTVDAGSPAQHSGLNRGDQLVAVNGAPVQHESHKQVVARIRQDPLQCYLTVQTCQDSMHVTPTTVYSNGVDLDDRSSAVHSDSSVKSFELCVGPVSPVIDPTSVESPDTEKMRRFNGQLNERPDGQSATKLFNQGTPQTCHVTASEKMSALKFNGAQSPDDPMSRVKQQTINSKPKWCRLIKQNKSGEYGFNLMSERRSGFFIGKVDPGSVAQLAGLTKSLRVVGINYRIIDPSMPYKDIVTLVLKFPLHVTLLVVTEDVHHFYCLSKLSYDFSDADPLQARSPTSLYETIGAEFTDQSISQYRSNPDLHSVVQYRGDGSKPMPATRTRPASMYNTSLSDSPKKSPFIISDNFFRMNVSEVRQMIAQHKKIDPRNAAISLIEKYNIVRNL